MQSGDNLAVLAAYSIEFTMVEYLETISQRQIAAPVLKMGVLTDDFFNCYWRFAKEVCNESWLTDYSRC